MTLRKNMHLVVLTVGLVVAGVAVYLLAADRFWSGPGYDGDRAVQGPPSGPHSAQAFDVSDKRKLVGFADNVFVGRVLGQVGDSSIPTSDPGPGVPRTQYSVRVLENIEGNLSGTVTVSQEGGYVTYVPDSGPKEGQRVRELVTFGEDPMLEPGQTYLFVTRYDERRDYHQITTPKLGDIPINSEQERGALVEAFEEAAANQLRPLGVKR